MCFRQHTDQAAGIFALLAVLEVQGWKYFMRTICGSKVILNQLTVYLTEPYRQKNKYLFCYISWGFLPIH